MIIAAGVAVIFLAWRSGSSGVPLAQPAQVVTVPLAAQDTQEGPVLHSFAAPPATAPYLIEVLVGPLPVAARMVVATSQGARIGSIAPFGVTIDEGQTRPFQLTLDPQTHGTGDLTLQAKILVGDTERPATAQEFVAVRLFSQD